MNTHVEKYRPTMDNDVLRSWAEDAYKEILELRKDRERLRDVIKLAAASARQIGHDERFTGHSVAQGLEKALMESGED